MTELAADPAGLPHGTERELLVSFLDFYRSVLIRKAEGISDEQARLAVAEPSILTLVGLVRHMAEVERSWFRRWLAGDTTAGPIYYDDEDPDGDLRPDPNESMADALAVLDAEIEVARGLVARAESLDMVALGSSSRRPDWQPNLRWILIHLIEEYARHCGHADLLRERLDGAIGD